MPAIIALGMDAGARMLDTGGMTDTAKVSVKNTQLITDGPFTESKEMIGGYAVYELASPAEVITWVQRFADLHRQHWPQWEGEITVQQLHTFAMPG
jgi:hypothetical protein